MGEKCDAIIFLNVFFLQMRTQHEFEFNVDTFNIVNDQYGRGEPNLNF